MGGMIGFELAVRRPELLKSLTIVNSAPEVKPRTRAITGGGAAPVPRPCAGLKPSARPGPAALPQAGAGRTAAQDGQRWAQNDKRAYLASFDAIVGWGVQERLGRITCPTLVISADRDYTPVALKKAYVELLPNARLVVIEDSRHATPLDQPDVFNRPARVPRRSRHSNTPGSLPMP
jgi:pimeloyl-ACP methyl ester carboxylesterase